MTAPYLGEIKLISFNFPPEGWVWCDGQALSIAGNTALFSLLGTTYGGDGRTNFRVPDLRGRAALSWGNGMFAGMSGGSESVTITRRELPGHTHAATGVNGNANAGPTFHFFAAAKAAYQPQPYTTTLAPDTISSTGGDQPHENRQPYAVVGFVMAVTGIYPNQVDEGDES